VRAWHRWKPEDDEMLRRAWHEFGPGVAATARATGLTPGQVAGRAMRLNLHHGGVGRSAVPKPGNPAIAEGRTMFRSRVQPPAEAYELLKPGRDAIKLGGIVAKGAWRGMPIFSLTLEERATCPRSCAQWEGCYGNAMPFAKRIVHGPELEARLASELRYLSRRHRGGFVVRLHMLGDFYSVQYVAAWLRWLRLLPELHVFGYTAWAPETPIGAAVEKLARRAWDRFAVRRSGHDGMRGSVVVESPAQAAEEDFVVCPVQTGGTRSCATCGLCWAPAFAHRPIAFVRHGFRGA
jgi:hypothetical protein